MTSDDHEQLAFADRSVRVQRANTPPGSPLRGWTTADALMLEHLAVGPSLARTLVVNDAWGALSVGLASSEPWVWTDSALSRLSIDDNLELNGLAPLNERHVHGDQSPEGRFDTVVLMLPRSNARLAAQLGAIAAVVDERTRLVAGVMAKYLERRGVEMIEEYLGPTTVSRAERKARLIHVSPRSTLPAQPPARSFLGLVAPDGTQVASLAGLFSAERIDAGTALLIEHLASMSLDDISIAVDLGCGSGVIAAAAARQNPTANWLLVDVSDLAIAAARETWSRNGLDPARADFVCADGLAANVARRSVDLVVSNPPFHQWHARDLDLTERLLSDASAVLRDDGVAVFVGQRDLHLHTRLRRCFRDVRVASKHPSFVVVEARQPR